MKVIVCIDDDNGMLFNKRRQSRDRVLIDDVMEITNGSKLYIMPFSKLIFDGKNVSEDENCLDNAETNDYCFVENKHLKQYESKISELIVYKWNRKYPSDFKLDLTLSDYPITDIVEFPGFSHEKITRETYKIN